jgi:uncharacterized spore protein YtfJ
MDVQSLVEQAREALTVERVFGTPYEKNGIAVVPVANVRAGGGGGGGPTGGGGAGIQASPAGAFVIQGGSVRWQPAIDVNRIVFGCQIVALVALLTIRSVEKARARTKRRMAKVDR